MASYAALFERMAYVEPLAVGDKLPAMPLFLDAQQYVPVPFEATYREAWLGGPEEWREVLET